ncbi:MAG: aminoacyl-tRNA hydrolase [Acutalibacteraceae bacterium]|nr:aminoacyl-tRNA hydrolase [Acutalibacteraceae bacterium]
MVNNMFFKKKESAYDWLIVGLGNPGLQYEKTRHNAGFMVIDALAEKYGVGFPKRKYDALIGECKIGDNRIMLVKPQTFMNLSGKAVTAICSFYKIPYDKVIVMFDDVSLDVGKIRVRRKGSDGGHNGIKDIIELSGTSDIPRIKIGVGKKPNAEYDLKDWVLGKFSKEDLDTFQKATEIGVKAAEEIVKRGIDSAMNRYN